MPRFAAKISEDDFRRKLEDAIQSHGDFLASVEPGDTIIGHDSKYIIKNLNSKVTEDLNKFEFDLENFECEPSGSMANVEDARFLGIRTLSTGLTFLGCMAFGDWEFYTYFVIYWDGKNFRGYLPGSNHYNKKTKQAFGNNDAKDEKEGYFYGEYERLPGLVDKILADVEKRIQVR